MDKKYNEQTFSLNYLPDVENMPVHPEDLPYFSFIKLANSFTASLSLSMTMMPIIELSLLSELFWVMIISEDFRLLLHFEKKTII